MGGDAEGGDDDDVMAVATVTGSAMVGLLNCWIEGRKGYKPGIQGTNEGVVFKSYYLTPLSI